MAALGQRHESAFTSVDWMGLLPRPKKDLALLRKSTAPTYLTLLTRMSFMSTGNPRYGCGRFSLDPFSHHVSLCPISTFHLPHGSVIAGFWIVSKCWGEPWFPHCASIASWLTDYCMAFLCCCLFAPCFPLPYQSLR